MFSKGERKSCKRITLCAIMVLLMCLSACALAEELYEFYSEGYNYVLLEDGTAQITDCPSAYWLEIPEELEGHPVSSIAPSAIDYYTSKLNRVIIPDCVTRLEGNPVGNCPSLKTIEVSPDHPTLAIIDGVLFEKTTKKLVSYPGGLEDRTYEIPQGIVAIGDGAFNHTQISSLIYPDSVTSIGSYAFDGCDNITKVTIPDSVTSVGSYAYKQCHRLTKAVIPATLASISEGMFYGCETLTDVTIEEGVTAIGSKAFQWCQGLESLTLPSSVVTIGDESFAECSGLTEINLSEGLTAIGTGAFYRCRSLTQVTLPESLTSMGVGDFFGMLRAYGHRNSSGDDADLYQHLQRLRKTGECDVAGGDNQYCLGCL